MKVLELKNGIKVLVKLEKGYPVFAGSLFIPVGSLNEPTEGLTFLTLKTAVKYSRELPPLTFSKLQEELGTPFSAEVVSDYSVINFQGISEGLEEYFNLFFKVLSSPGFEKESFTVEKSSLLALIRSKRESSFSLAYETALKEGYKGTPYSKLPYGTKESISPLSLKEVETWYERAFVPEGSVLSLCGELNKVEKVLNLIEEIETKPVSRPSFKCNLAEDREVFVNREGSEQSFILVSINAPSVKEESFHAYKLLNTLLGEGIGSLLFQELREKRGYAYSTGSFYPTRLNTSRLFLYVGTSPEKWKKVKEELFLLISNLPDYITPERVKRAKEYFKGTYLLDHELRGKRAWYYGFWEIQSKGWNYDGEFIDKVLSVGRDELLKASEEVLKSPKLTVVVNDEEGSSR
ncbi:M16 family metallopeptidase [Thermovibrio sp.]